MTSAVAQHRLVPFLKWAGGKRWLATSYPDLFPSCTQHLIEPFCGSCAVFFTIRPDRATLSDSNAKLIECYLVVRDDVHNFMRYFHDFCSLHSRNFYYTLRQTRFDRPAARAAQFVYLNRVCFNGIYRENLSGQFNVPIGTKPKASLRTDNFPAISHALQSVSFLNCDFEACIDKAQEGDFLYIDPPYVTRQNSNGFAKYNRRIFSWQDQVRLAKAVTRAAARRVSIVLSNADHADVRALYATDFRIISLDRATVIASKSKHRGRTSEIVGYQCSLAFPSSMLVQ